MPTVNSPSKVFNLAALRAALLTRGVFRPLLLLFRAALNHLTFHLLWFCLASILTCRVQHSRPATSASIPSSRLVTQVGSPVNFTLHTTEPTLSATKPHRCRRTERSRGTLATVAWVQSPAIVTTPAHHEQGSTQARSAPRIYQVPAPGTRYQVPVPSSGRIEQAKKEGASYNMLSKNAYVRHIYCTRY